VTGSWAPGPFHRSVARLQLAPTQGGMHSIKSSRRNLSRWHSMSIELKIPMIGESITEVQILDWLKSPGEAVRQDEPIVSLETEKISLDLPAPVSGILVRTLKKKGELAEIGEVIAYLEEAKASKEPGAPAPRSATPAVKPTTTPLPNPLPAEQGTDVEKLMPTGPEPVHMIETAPKEITTPPRPPSHRAMSEREEEALPMSLLRRRVAERLVQAQQTAALLTTPGSRKPSRPCAQRGGRRSCSVPAPPTRTPTTRPSVASSTGSSSVRASRRPGAGWMRAPAWSLRISSISAPLLLQSCG